MPFDSNVLVGKNHWQSVGNIMTIYRERAHTHANEKYGLDFKSNVIELRGIVSRACGNERIVIIFTKQIAMSIDFSLSDSSSAVFFVVVVRSPANKLSSENELIFRAV